jgi:hypothetical protein
MANSRKFILREPVTLKRWKNLVINSDCGLSPRA